MRDKAEALRLCARGDLPPNIALMHLLIEAESADAVALALAEALQATRGDAEAQSRIAEAAALWQARPDAWSLVRAVIGGIDHGGAAGGEAAIDAAAAAFDRAVRISPEAGVALYSLGDPALLARVTDEIVRTIGRWGLLTPERRVLDLGCGIGRIAAALAPHVAQVTGIDVSGAMIELAAKRLSGLPNVRVLQSSGRDLGLVGSGSTDLVLAVDSFPYIVQAGHEMVHQHIGEAARVLAPGGDLLILNYSYRRDAARDRHELQAHAEAAGLAVLRAGTGDFTLWDGLTYHLRKPS